MADAHPLLRRIKRRSTSPIGPVQYADLGEPLTHEPIPIRACFRLEDEAFLRTDIEAIITGIAEAAYGTVGPFMKAFYERFSEICEGAGTAFDAKGKPIGWEVVLDCLERMDIGFDENDDPMIPSYWAGPPKLINALLSQPFTEAHQQRLDSILDRKRVEHDARKRHRRLS